MTINLAAVRHFFTSISDFVSRKPIPGAPRPLPRTRGGRVPDHVCPPFRDRIVMVSRECEAAIIAALKPFPEARSAVAHVLDRFLRPEPELCLN